MASEIDNAIANPVTYGDEAKIHAVLKQFKPDHFARESCTGRR